jgi:hypothetical protein
MAGLCEDGAQHTSFIKTGVFLNEYHLPKELVVMESPINIPQFFVFSPIWYPLTLH